MQETHPRVWEMRDVARVFIPADADVVLAELVGAIHFVCGVNPVHLGAIEYPQPVHFGGCI